MAKIVLGMGTSHSPQLSAPVEQWQAKGVEDRNDPRVGDYDTMVKQKADWMGPEITKDKMTERHAAIQRSIETLAETMARVAPDIVVTIGDDQREVFSADHMPAIAIYWGESVDNIPPGPDWKHKHNPWFTSSIWANYGETATTYPCQPALAKHLVQALTGAEFDIAHIRKLGNGQKLGHAYNFVYRRLMSKHMAPQVPLMLNTYYPPNQPTARRCFALGQALRRAIESWDSDETVAIVASGGLSHFVVDAEMDRGILSAMEKRDEVAMLGYPEDLYVHGTSETKSWITLAGAMHDLPTRMELIDYLPGYRSVAGTGCGCAFAQWIVNS